MSAIDLDIPENLAEAVRSGAIWSAPGWAIEMALEAINNHTIPVPPNVPERFTPYITASPSDVVPVEPAGGAASA
jgi:hypothetical protein